jgi:hypothetical protein
MRNAKKSKDSSSTATTPLAAHAPYAPPTFSAPGLQQFQSQVVGAQAASFPHAQPTFSDPGLQQFQSPPHASFPPPPVVARRKPKPRTSLGLQAAANSIQLESELGKKRGQNDMTSNKFQDSKPGFSGGKKQTKNKRKKNKPKTKRRAANKKNKKAHAGRVSRHNKVFRRKTRKSK